MFVGNSGATRRGDERKRRGNEEKKMRGRNDKESRKSNVEGSKQNKKKAHKEKARHKHTNTTQKQGDTSQRDFKQARGPREDDQKMFVPGKRARGGSQRITMGSRKLQDDENDPEKQLSSNKASHVSGLHLSLDALTVVEDPTTNPSLSMSASNDFDPTDDATLLDSRETFVPDDTYESVSPRAYEDSDTSSSSTSSSTVSGPPPESLTVAVLLENFSSLTCVERLPRSAKRVVLSRGDIEGHRDRTDDFSRFLLTKTLDDTVPDHILSSLNIETSVYDRYFEDWIVLDDVNDISNFAKIRLSLLGSRETLGDQPSQSDSSDPTLARTRTRSITASSSSSVESTQRPCKYELNEDEEETPDNGSTMSDEELALLATRMQDPKTGVTIKDRRYLMRVYKKCFIGYEAVTWIMKNLGLASREEGVRVGQMLVQSFFVSHVCYDHGFKDKYLFYHFCKGSGDELPLSQRITERLNPQIIESVDRITLEMATFEVGVKTKKRRWRLKQYENCFVGEEAVTWMCRHLGISRSNGCLLGDLMMERGLIVHVTNSHTFLDEPHLYIFTPKLLSLQRNNPDAGLFSPDDCKKDMIRTQSAFFRPSAAPAFFSPAASLPSNAVTRFQREHGVAARHGSVDISPIDRSVMMLNNPTWCQPSVPSPSSSSSSSSSSPTPKARQENENKTFKVVLDIPTVLPREEDDRSREKKVKTVKMVGEGFAYATYEGSGSLVLYNMDAGSQEFLHNESPISVVHHEYPWIVSYHEDHSIQLYNIQTGVGKRFGFYASELVRAPQAILLDDDHLVAVSPDELTIWKTNTNSPRPLKRLNLSTDGGSFQSLSQPYCQIQRNHILLCDQWQFQVWNWVDEKVVLEGSIDKHAYKNAIFFHARMCYDTVVTISSNDLKIWKMPSGAARSDAVPPSPVRVALGTFVTALYVDYCFVIMGTTDGDLLVHRRKTGELLCKLNDAPLSCSSGGSSSSSSDSKRNGEYEDLENSAVTEQKRNAIFTVCFLCHILFSSLLVGLILTLRSVLFCLWDAGGESGEDGDHWAQGSCGDVGL